MLDFTAKTLLTFALAPVLPLGSDGVVTNLSIIQIPQWFFALTPFEAVFIGLTFLWICMIQVVGILPLNINNFFQGSPSGRKKRRRRAPSSAIEIVQNTNSTKPILDDNVLSLLDTVKRIDTNECVPRALCILERESTHGRDIGSNGIREILEVLRSLRYLKLYNSNSSLAFYDWAMKVGERSTLFLPSSNSSSTERLTMCHQFYPACDVTTNQILSYVNALHFDDMM